ncbi:MAG: sulfite oxidase-like oxidoreductase [Anaerolineaceae bacterium]|nr:sulfite oxidase-like oxidoreductase [Anaerolineaceae bacterium]
MKMDRLPPGQTRTSGFPALHTGPIPDFSPATWDFRVWGEVEEPVVWTWDQFQVLPRVAIQLDLHCVTKWSKLDTAWEGISLRTLIDGGWVRPKPTARFVMQHADYGYTTNLPLEVALQDNFILATHFDGQPLTPAHGFPVRGVVGSIPGREDLKDVYLWKSAKWLRGLEFLCADMLGFWEANGYHNEGDVWKEQRRADNP